jgi:hypothetical protein
MTTNLLLPPTRTDADAAFLVLQIDRAHAMSGSNAMCVVTALLETGTVAMRETRYRRAPGHASGPRRRPRGMRRRLLSRRLPRHDSQLRRGP